MKTRALYLHSSQFGFALSLALFVLQFILAAPSLATEKYIFILPALGNPYWQTVKQGIEDGAKEIGIAYSVLTPITDQAKEEPLNLCQTAVSQKPAIIVICTTTAPIGLQCLRIAQANRIKVAALDAMISIDDAKKSGINLMFSIGTDNVAVGKRPENTSQPTANGRLQKF